MKLSSILDQYRCCLGVHDHGTDAVLNLQILEAVRPAAAKLGLDNPLQLWGYFVSQCKRNLHVVLCMSPIGDAFRSVLCDGICVTSHQSTDVCGC